MPNLRSMRNLIMLRPLPFALNYLTFYYTKHLLTKQGEFCVLTKEHNNPVHLTLF